MSARPRKNIFRRSGKFFDYTPGNRRKNPRPQKHVSLDEYTAAFEAQRQDTEDVLTSTQNEGPFEAAEVDVPVADALPDIAPDIGDIDRDPAHHDSGNITQTQYVEMQ